MAALLRSATGVAPVFARRIHTCAASSVATTRNAIVFVFIRGEASPGRVGES